MDKRNIIVIGASAGGFEAIRQLVAGLPKDLNAAIFIVWHMSPDLRGILPDVLNRIGTLPASAASQGESISMGHIYVAIPDHHLIVFQNEIHISKGPKENRFRPAIDPLFRSAALAFGPRVIGIILSGALDDGAAGLWAVKTNGGVAIVQDPSDAEVPSMPENAMQAVQADYILPAKEIGPLLADIVNENAEFRGLKSSAEEQERTELEIDIAMEKHNSRNILDFSELAPYTCPECHGVLSSIREGELMRFRCHTGHAFSIDTLLSLITEKTEENLWSAVRIIQESIFLMNHIGDHLAEINQPKIAAVYFKKAKEAETRARLLRDALMSHEHVSGETILQQADKNNPAT